MAKQGKEEKGVYRVEVRLNPARSSQDAEIVAKLERSPVTPGHLIKMLMVNYFCTQPGGFGLTDEEQISFARFQPKYANKKRKDLFPDGAPDHDKPQKVESKKHKESVGSDSVTKVADAKVEASTVATVDNKDSNVVVPGSGRPPWGPGNLPPGFDTSDFEDFVG